MNKKTEDTENAESIYNNVENSKLKKVLSVMGQAILLIFVGIVLYVIGNLLSNVLTNLCVRFKLPEIVIGMLLGFITSIPELITFFESQKHYKNKKVDDILGVVEATNNLLTSNILNLFIIQSVGVIIFALMH